MWPGQDENNLRGFSVFVFWNYKSFLPVPFSNCLWSIHPCDSALSLSSVIPNLSSVFLLKCLDLKDQGKVMFGSLQHHSCRKSDLFFWKGSQVIPIHQRQGYHEKFAEASEGSLLFHQGWRIVLLWYSILFNGVWSWFHIFCLLSWKIWSRRLPSRKRTLRGEQLMHPERRGIESL